MCYFCITYLMHGNMLQRHDGGVRRLLLLLLRVLRRVLLLVLRVLRVLLVLRRVLRRGGRVVGPLRPAGAATATVQLAVHYYGADAR